MALEFIIHDGNRVVYARTCLDCLSPWSSVGDNTHCPKCDSTNIQVDDIGYKHRDIITLDYSPSSWSESEVRTVVFMEDAEVEKLIVKLGFESEDDVWTYLDSPKRVDGIVVARKAYRIDCDFINTDGNFIHITADNVIEK